MIIYHGSNLTVETPKILVPNRYLDFGTGFYTTTNFDQALSFIVLPQIQGNKIRKGEF